MAKQLPNTAMAWSNSRTTSAYQARADVASRDALHSMLFTRLSIAVFLTIAASIVATALLFNQGY